MYIALFSLLLVFVLRLNRSGGHGISHALCLLASIAVTSTYFMVILRYTDSWDSFVTLVSALVNHWT